MAKGERSLRELSTRIWLDEELWNAIRSRAIAERTTVRALIPHLLGQIVAGQRGVPSVPEILSRPPGTTPPAAPAPAEAGPPVVVLAEMYRCDICGAEVRLGGLSNHMGKHLKERRAAEAEGS